MGKETKQNEEQNWVDVYMDYWQKLLQRAVLGELTYADKDRENQELKPKGKKVLDFAPKKYLFPTREGYKEKFGFSEPLPLPARWCPSGKEKRYIGAKISEIDKEIKHIKNSHPPIRPRLKGERVIYDPTPETIEFTKQVGLSYRIAPPWEVRLRHLENEKEMLGAYLKGTNPEIERWEKRIEKFKELRKKFMNESMERNREVIEFVKKRLEDIKKGYCRDKDTSSDVFSAYFQLFVEYDPQKAETISRDQWISDLLYKRALNRIKKEIQIKSDVSLDSTDENQKAYNEKKLYQSGLYEEDPYEQIENRDQLNRFKKSLSPRESEVEERFLQGYTEEEIATKLGISQARVSAILKQVIIKAKKSNQDKR